MPSPQPCGLTSSLIANPYARAIFVAKRVAHAECSPDVLQEADFLAPTSAMGRWLESDQLQRVASTTDCAMAGNLSSPMQRIDLRNIYRCQRDFQHEIILPAETLVRARRPLDRMLAAGRQDRV